MNEKAIAAAIEPLLDDLVALEKKVDQIKLTAGPQGEAGRSPDAREVVRALAADGAFLTLIKGADGKDGERGNDGAGIDAPQYKAGDIYRAGAAVVANIGQHFIAMKDTASAPGASDDWARVGSGGFRHRGAFDKDATYADGDLFVKDFGTFCVIDGAPALFAGRGAQGKQGATGLQGIKGRDGRDGSTIIAAQAEGFKLVLVQQHGDGAIDHIEADFAPAYRELVREALGDLRAEIEALRAELREAIA